MARKASTAQAKKPASRTQGRAGAGASKRGAKAAQAAEHQLIDDRTRRDIAGVAFIVLAVVLFVAAVLPTDALVTSFVSAALHLTLGLGAYLLPLVLAAVGVCFIVRFDRERVPLRAAVGLALVFVALLTIMALFTPESAADGTDRLFLSAELTARGGYVGAGLAWVGLTLFGQVVSCIVMVGVIAVGILVIGFSLNGVIERVRAAREEREAALDVQPAPPFARARRAGASVPLVPTVGEAPLNAADTHVMPKQAAQAAAAEAAPTRKLSKRHTGASADFEGEAPQQITRKLGRSRSVEPNARPVPPTPPSKAAATPLAAPSPEEGFTLPSFDLLATTKDPQQGLASDAEVAETGECLQETLESFDVDARVVGWVAGPTVTLFKIDLGDGVRVSKIQNLENDIALALAAPGVRIFAPIPNTNYVGIEVPNRTRQSVLLGDVLKDAPKGPLQVAIGKDVEGHCIVSDLAKMPHLLIGGTTGSGKSVSINAMIMSILMRATPAEVRFIMIDPKRVEFSPYNGIPHLYVPVVTEPKEAASALSWGVAEMERRLKVFSKVGARNIGQYNAKVQAALAEAERAEEAGEEPPESDLTEEMPYIVIIIDELADLMMNVGKEVEFSISRIAQLARAAGIHLIVATQRPSTNVVTGLIKANITNRIAFNVASSIDSRVILDTKGAENLIGLGDLLLSKPEYARPVRMQGCYVSEDEINAVVDMLKEQGEPEYHSEILQTNLITLGASQPDGSGGSCTDDDPLLWEAAEVVVTSGFGSTSSLQRRLKVGYSRAGRIMDMLEEHGVVGPANGSKPREVLVSDVLELETLKAFEQNDE